MPLPTNQQELWTRILILLQKNHGFVSREDVESTLGLSFTSTETEGERLGGTQYFHSLRQEVPGLGLVSVGLRDNPAWIVLSLDWGPERAETPHCLPLNQATRDWNALGWQPGSRTVGPGRGHLPFYRTADWTVHLRDRKPLDVETGVSRLGLSMPSQLSQCVNGTYAWIWRSE